MSTRRPRVKAAAILKPRRPITANDQSNAENKTSAENADETITNSTKKCQERCDDAVEDDTNKAPERVKSPAPPSENQQDSKVGICKIEEDIKTIESKPSLPSTETEAAAAAPPSDTSAPVKTVPKPSASFRRISAPPVNIINRRRSIIENRSANCASPKYIRSPSYSFVSQLKPNGSPHHGGSSVAAIKPGDEEVFSPASTTNAAVVDNDECFKSPPFMSPIYTPRRTEPNTMSPFHDIYGEDCTKSPSQLPNNSNSNGSSNSSNAKLRQRIRPTPCFASRRNSIQGNGLSALSAGGGMGSIGGCESEDEQYRRQRHYSTSSNHSAYNPASTPQHQRNYFGLNKMPARVRTESYSSSISDMPFSKAKRSHRSEEYQRVANAKREFNQRLNGKPPDKTRLTMYDLIYYNPLTNPMSKPAGKGGADGGKNGDGASIASAKTNHSRASMKSEASVKSERSDSHAVRHAAAAAATTAAAAATAAASEATTADAAAGASTAAATANGPVPQLKLDVNGEIILDEKSLVIETTANKEAREVLASSDVVYDDEFSGTSGFYKRQKRTRDWLPLETLKFYRSLQTIGTDFSVMLQLFPNRSRRDLKLKFKKEEKHNMALINKALLHPKEFNVDELKLQFDKEDEEIEQKKQEWAEVRKRMATERREQLNASKRRNPNKQISRAMRSLTDGDILYENEFVALPPKARRNRKRNVVPPDDSVFSPPSINHNNNHVDTLPQHTYATHKLPNFLEMIAAQHKSTQQNNPIHHQQTDQQQSQSVLSSSPYPSPSHDPNSNQILPINYTVHNDRHKFISIEPNGDTGGGSGTFHTDEDDNYDDESMHAIDLSTTALNVIANTAAAQSPIIIHGTNAAAASKNITPTRHPTNNGNKDVIDVVDSSGNESIQIGQYIAKNPNLTFKGTGDIMNMDIIFENVSIEEDTSIGEQHNTNTTTPTTTDDTNCSIESAAAAGAAARDKNDDGYGGGVAQQVEHVNINGVHYQIITIENETITDDVTHINEDTEFIEGEGDDEEEGQPQQQQQEIIDESAISVISQPNQEHDQNDVDNCDVIDDANIMVMPNLDIAAEVEMAGDMDDEEPDESTMIVTVPMAPSAPNIKSEAHDLSLPITAVVDVNDDDKTTVAQPFNAANDRRKRKQKIIPLLAYNKRARRNQPAPPQLEQQQPHLDQSKSIAEEIVPSNSKHERDINIEPAPYDTTGSSACIESTPDQMYAFQSEKDNEQIASPDQTFNDDDDDDHYDGEDGEEGDDTHSDGDVPERNFLDSLVVVESQDPNEPDRMIHEVFVVDPDTNQMSEKPLDLPDHVIQRIRLAIA